MQLFFGGLLVLIDKLGLAGVGGDLGAPIVLDGDEVGVVVGVFVELDVERGLAVEGEVLQDALAEAVDGVDGGVVKIADGGGEAQLQAVLAFAGEGLGEQVEEEVVGTVFVIQAVLAQDFRLRLGVGRAFKRGKGLVQAGAQAGFELGGGGFGEGYHEDFFYVLFFQQHEAGEQGGDVPCFACACAGFDKVDAVYGDGERVERGGGGHVGSLKTGWGGETTGAMIA